MRRARVARRALEDERLKSTVAQTLFGSAVHIVARAPRNHQTEIIRPPHCLPTVTERPRKSRAQQSSACNCKSAAGVSHSLRVCNASVCCVECRLAVSGSADEGGLAVAAPAIPGALRIGCGSARRSFSLAIRFRCERPHRTDALQTRFRRLRQAAQHRRYRFRQSCRI